LIVDGTKVGFTHQFLIVSLAYRKRVIPLAWSWAKQIKGHATPEAHLALLAYVRSLLPKGIDVLLVGGLFFAFAAGPLGSLPLAMVYHWVGNFLFQIFMLIKVVIGG
jgi:hypothetical protein